MESSTAESVGKKDNITSLQRQLGEYYLAKQEAGEVLDSEAMAFCEQIYQARAQIADLEAEITKIKVARATQSAFPDGRTRFVPAAAKPVQANVKFCPGCGCAVAVAAPKEKTCPGCGKQVPDNVKFCPSCGSKIDSEETSL